MTTGEMPKAALSFPIDGHVHFHLRELVSPTLDAAAANFSQAAKAGEPLLGALLLAESSREHVFEQLVESRGFGRWRLERLSGEPQTLIASSQDGGLAIVAGRQVRCALGLEALALGTTRRYQDGGPLREQVERIVRDGGLAVVPWGFGKWTGEARRTVTEFFASSKSSCVFAGDNGGRMQLTGRPRLLRQAGARGLRILPGTDPFPFGGDYRRVGAFGFMAPPPDSSKPWTSLHAWLASGGTPQPYGRGLNPPHFLFNQGWIQLRNRFLRGTAQ